MKKLLSVTFVVSALLAAPALSQQTAAPGAAAPPGGGTAGLPAVRHLVYEFGYNTKAAKSGNGTGTTTIDIGGLAADGGMTVTATDEWWNTVRPRQSYTCEVHPNGSVNCAQPPNAISPIQIAVVPLLGQHYFSALSASPTASWQQKYNVRATFIPGATTGFAGQVNTWNGSYSLQGKGHVPKGQPVILVQSEGALKQQGGRYITVNQKAGIVFDPRIKMPVLVDEEFTFVPRLSINRYTVELKLIRT
jgi:hypothetical protein